VTFQRRHHRIDQSVTGVQPVPVGHRAGEGDERAQLIMPPPTVTPVASSMRTNEPVVRFFS
jgi:hypothetical protein